MNEKKLHFVTDNTSKAKLFKKKLFKKYKNHSIKISDIIIVLGVTALCYNFKKISRI